MSLNLLDEDILLWNRFRQGDDVALGKLMQRYFSALYEYGCSFSRRPELVDDTIQELFFDLWQRRDRLSNVTRVQSYLLVSLRNRLVASLRKPGQWLLRDELTEDEVGFEGEFVIESQLVEEDESQTQALQQLLGQLSKRQREAIYLRFYQNLDNESIADLMRISRPAVSNLISTAITQLRKHWGNIISLFISAFTYFL